ncbi:hypothetical protein TBS_26770 [Thermobispora bispora]|uniref:Uncharacterized protein n=1 Tax=Thermobispora bispora (strain ATCC 19993 / DSM 43833 / CBS 139.67 / JCM 10125 / KCTC 9307 / NBRC 14880 / R51) TaxID=469371 RepID=D6Y537_THEBD|nr:hypothetical protein Tbis_0585 [Thermobispora bispora DSM 43833]
MRAPEPGRIRTPPQAGPQDRVPALEHAPLPFRVEQPLPTLRYGDLALTSTRPADGAGGRVQVVRRRPGGTWERIIDRPEPPTA